MEDITNEAIESTEYEIGAHETPSDEDTSAPDETPETEVASEPISPLLELMQRGLSEREATLVLNDREKRQNPAPTYTDSLPRMAHSPRLNISYGELMQMKEIFEGLSDTEINRLYNKVTK